jgi:DNA polymerase elongation subunit (family B)
VISNGFSPYFVIKKPPEWIDRDYTRFVEVLEQVLRKQVGNYGTPTFFDRLVLATKTFKAFDLYGYHGEEPEEFVKIYVAYPELVRKCRLLLEYPLGRVQNSFLPEIDGWWPDDLPCPVEDPYRDSEKHRGFPKYFEIFEANVDFMLRFQVDHKIRATGWVKVQSGGYDVVPQEERVSTCQIEIRCYHGSVGYSTKTTKQVPPMGVYSYDAEVLIGPDFRFPEAIYYKKASNGSLVRGDKGKPIPIPGSGEQMIQMGFMKIQGDTIKKGIHMVSDSSAIESADQVYCYRDESSFLRGFRDDIVKTDPTFMIDFNGNSFDKPYFIDRMKQNEIWKYHCVLGRIKRERSDYR